MSEKKSGQKNFSLLGCHSEFRHRRNEESLLGLVDSSVVSPRANSLRMTTALWTHLLFFLALLFHACYPAARLKLPPEELTPEKVLGRAIANQELIISSSSLISFNFKSSQEGFSGDLELFFKQPDSFAFRVKAFLGPDYVSGVLDSDSLLLVFPRTRQYYKGDNPTCSKGAFSKAGFDLFCLLKILLSETRMDKKRAHYTGVDQKSYIYQDTTENWKRDFWVDQNEGFIRKSIWERLDSSEKKKDEIRGLVIEYKDFQKFDGIMLSRVVEIKSLSGKEKLKLKFLERNINKPISEKKFQIKIPEDAKQVEINGAG